METRVYLIDLNDYEGKVLPTEITDEEFMNISEKQGKVYTLKNFEKEWNSQNVIFNSFIRFVDVEIPKERIHMGYQVVDINDKGEFHPEIEASFIVYSKPECEEMIDEEEKNDWKIVPIYYDDIEEPTITFSGNPDDPFSTDEWINIVDETMLKVLLRH